MDFKDLLGCIKNVLHPLDFSLKAEYRFELLWIMYF